MNCVQLDFDWFQQCWDSSGFLWWGKFLVSWVAISLSRKIPVQVLVVSYARITVKKMKFMICPRTWYPNYCRGLVFARRHLLIGEKESVSKISAPGRADLAPEIFFTEDQPTCKHDKTVTWLRSRSIQKIRAETLALAICDRYIYGYLLLHDYVYINPKMYHDFLKMWSCSAHSLVQGDSI